MRVSDDQVRFYVELAKGAVGGEIAADLLDARARVGVLESALRDIATGRHRFGSEAAERALAGAVPAPAPEAVIKATIEAAAENVRCSLTTGLLTPGNVAAAVRSIRALASDPAAVRAILLAAKEQP